MWIRNAWYVAGWSHEFAPGAIHARTLIDQPIALYRTADGALVETIKGRLVPFGVAVYVAEHDNKAGHHLPSKVETEIVDSDLVVVLLTARGSSSNFVNQEIALDGERLACSRLFKWYRADFEAAGGLAPFLLRHLDDGPARRELAAGASPCAAFRPYSWSLQHQPAD